MADVTGSGFNGDATGGIGQGLAFVLPEGKSAEYAMNLAQTHGVQLQKLAQQKVATQQKAQQQYEKDFKDQTIPKAFAPFDKELSGRFDNWLSKGAAMHAETGKNPYLDTDYMKEYNDNILVPASRSLDLGTNYAKLRATAETDPTNKYTKESKQAVIDFQNQIEKDPFGTLDKQMPALVETPPSVDNLIKDLKPTTDPSNNKAQAFSALLGDPKYHSLLKDAGYNPDLPDFGVYTDPKHPNGKRVWYTNPTFTDWKAGQILASPDDPSNANTLKTLGIDPNDQYAKEKLQHAIADQNAAMGKVVSNIGGRMDAMVDPEKFQQLADQKQNQQFRERSLNISQAHLDLDRQKEAREAEKQNDTKVADDWSDRILSGKHPEAGRQLSNHFETNPAYGKPLIIKENDAGDKVDITVPPKIKLNPNYNPAVKESNLNPKTIEVAKSYTIKLDKNDPIDLKSKVAYLIKQAGGSKNLMKEDKPPVDGKTPSSQKVLTGDKINSMIGKKGYEGYTKQELIDYYKAQGYTIK